jgi:hypothetical protein
MPALIARETFDAARDRLQAPAAKTGAAKGQAKRRRALSSEQIGIRTGTAQDMR